LQAAAVDLPALPLFSSDGTGHLFSPSPKFQIAGSGAEDGIRTRDLRFTKPLLYQLSYFGLTAERGEHAIHSPSRKL
jgi:hypothetical protein